MKVNAANDEIYDTFLYEGRLIVTSASEWSFEATAGGFFLRFLSIKERNNFVDSDLGIEVRLMNDFWVEIPDFKYRAGQGYWDERVFITPISLGPNDLLNGEIIAETPDSYYVYFEDIEKEKRELVQSYSKIMPHQYPLKTRRFWKK